MTPYCLRNNHPLSPELILCHRATYPNSARGELSPWSADTPVSTGKTTTSVQTPCPRGTLPEPPGQRNLGTVGDRIFLVFVCTLELTL